MSSFNFQTTGKGINRGNQDNVRRRPPRSASWSLPRVEPTTISLNSAMPQRPVNLPKTKKKFKSKYSSSSTSSSSKSSGGSGDSGSNYGEEYFYTPPELLDPNYTKGTKTANTKGNYPEISGYLTQSTTEVNKFNFPIDFPLDVQEWIKPDEVDSTWFSIIGRFVFADANYTNSAAHEMFDIIYHEMTTEVIQTIRSKIIDIWTLGNFREYIYAITHSLSLIYSLESIISYRSSNRKDKNRFALEYSAIVNDPDILDKLNQLKLLCKGAYCPPNLNRLVHWTYQYYKIGNTDQATNFRFSPSENFVFEDGDSLTDFKTDIVNELKEYINLLNGSTLSKMNSILLTVEPQNRIVNLMKPTNFSVNDMRINELVVNTPIRYSTVASTAKIFPVYSGSDPAEYFIFDEPENNSGFIYAMSTQYNNEFVYSNSTENRDFNLTGIFDTALAADDTRIKGHCNKWVAQYNPTANTYYMENMYKIKHEYNCLSGHIFNTNTTEDAVFSIKPPFTQRVFFNTGRQTTMVVREFITRLFNRF